MVQFVAEDRSSAPLLRPSCSWGHDRALRFANSTPFGVQLTYGNHEIHPGRGLGPHESADSRGS